ncbi:MAG TPA: hypothetical protein VGE08_03330 [Steroidobacter sp.]|uniref:hypothetical protein n=1 Tax=Steroidobacter sp. TaxID=1978227 RepID=UPI002EDB7569
MNIHTRFVGAFYATILSLTAAVNVALMLTLLVPSFEPPELLVKRGTVTIRQLAMDDAAAVRHM